MLKFTINKFLELRLENNQTDIYIKNNLFMHCKHILLNLPIENYKELENIDSIDEFVEKIERDYKNPNVKNLKICPKTIFWAHCSNLQVWYENNYDSRLIHSNLAFPLLKELTKAGDRLAKTVFKEEVARRFERSSLKVKQFILKRGYLDFLNKDELSILLLQTKSNLIRNIIHRLRELMRNSLLNYRQIKELIDVLLFIDLKYDQKSIHSVLDNLNKKYKIKFARFVTLHLNYKTFDDYKLPYGKFVIYVEELFDFLNINCPKINEFLSLIDSGFLNSSFSLDEKRSYGYVSYL